MGGKALIESDYIGKQYGKLTVLGFSHKVRTSMYALVKCECGNTKTVQLNSLKNGTTTSCGCLNKVTADDFIGQIFGRLKVFDHHRNDKGDLFLDCVCECGNTKSVRLYDLKKGATQSCGCLMTETTIKNNKARKRYNEFRYLDENTVCVLLSNCDDYMLCDAVTWDVLSICLWHKHHSGYACATYEGRSFAYHTMILECPDGYVRDHINRDRLDNRYENLRIVTPTYNAINRTLLDKNKYGYPGIYFDEVRNRWRSFYADPDTKKTIFSDFKTFEEALADRKIKEEMYYKIESLTTNQIIRFPVVSRLVVSRVSNKSSVSLGRNSPS